MTSTRRSNRIDSNTRVTPFRSTKLKDSKKTYRLSLYALCINIVISIAWFILLEAGPSGAGASFALLYPLLAFLLAAPMYIISLDAGFRLSFIEGHKLVARKSTWISITSGLLPAVSIFITFDNSPLLQLSYFLFAIYSVIAIVFVIKIKRSQ